MRLCGVIKETKVDDGYQMSFFTSSVMNAHLSLGVPWGEATVTILGTITVQPFLICRLPAVFFTTLPVIHLCLGLDQSLLIIHTQE
jgi:hypothetical protein